MDDRIGPSDAQRLVDRLETVAGDALRGAIWYEDGEFTLLHIRSDIEGMYTQDDIDRIASALVIEEPEDLDDLSQHGLGKLEAKVRWFSEGILVHAIAGDSSGIAAGFDHTVATDIPRLVSMTTAFLDGAR